jgi:signal peptidase II
MLARIIFLVIIFDFAFKGMVRQGFIKSSVQLNEGLAFSIAAPTLVSIIVTATILVVLFLYYKNREKNLAKNQQISFGMILGGALANLLERVYSGYVTDFIYINTVVLNLADLSIIVGLIILVTYEFNLKRLRSSQRDS